LTQLGSAIHYMTRMPSRQVTSTVQLFQAGIKFGIFI
jgi:hypothetical protein